MQFLFCDALTNRRIDVLDVNEWEFGDPLRGSGQFKAEMAVRPENVSRVRQATTPDGIAVYATEDDVFLWGGPITDRVWNSKRRTLRFEASQWESWFYTRLNPSLFVRLNIEQLRIAREMVLVALQDFGTPTIALGTETTSITREATYKENRSIGEMLDSLSSRDRGFDWSIQVRRSSQTGDVEPYLALWYPERSKNKPGTILFSAREGGNILAYDWPESSAHKRNRVKALGAGSPPDQLSAVDEDPALKADVVLLRETVSTHSSVTNGTTLFDHARAERLARDVPLQVAKMDVRADNPRVSAYYVGDRTRVRILDEWVDVDLPAARIIDRTVRGGRSKVTSCTLSINLSDSEMPMSGVEDDATQPGA